MNTQPILVFGHKNPDADTVIGSLAAAELQNRRGMPSVAVVQGEINAETSYILERFGLEAPAGITDVAGRDVTLVDFSDKKQGPQGLEQASVVSLFDHHKLGDVTTASPLEIWAWPVGSSNTILKAVFDFYGIAIPKALAGAMLSAIVSDTVMFKSPTTTERDHKAAVQLAGIAGIDDIEELAMGMFKAKSDIANVDVRDLALRDFKDFTIGNMEFGIGQIELVDTSVLDPIKNELMDAIHNLRVEANRHTVMLMVTDIMKEGSLLLVDSEDRHFIEKTFELNMKHGEAWVEGMMSRKKQVLPPLQHACGF